MKRMLKRCAMFAAALACAAGASLAHAQAWPQRPLRIVVPYTPGGATDITARLLADHMSKALGQPVTVENRSGASGTLGTEVVAKADPDGYTLALVASSHVVNKALFPRLSYDPITSFAPIVQTANVQLALVVPASLKVATVKDLIALAKSQPGVLSYASSGSGSNPQLFAEMFKQAAGISAQHVPYRGSTAAHADLIAGRTQFMFDAIAAVAPHVQSGRLRVLGVAGPKRSPQWPEVPTIAEGGLKGYGAASWGALLAPAGTPPAVIDRINREAVRALNSAEVRARLETLGAEVIGSTPQQLADLMKREEERYTKLVHDLDIKPD